MATAWVTKTGVIQKFSLYAYYLGQDIDHYRKRLDIAEKQGEEDLARKYRDTIADCKSQLVTLMMLAEHFKLNWNREIDPEIIRIAKEKGESGYPK